MDIKKAKQNRKEFLKPYRERFERAKTAKKRAKIISELIGIEPSHLSEPWIIKEVVSWLRDRECADLIDDAFIKAPKKYARTEKQNRREFRDFYIMDVIEKIMQDKNIGIRAACHVLHRRIIESDDRYYLLWDTENGNQNFDAKVIYEAYKNAKKKQTKFYP